MSIQSRIVRTGTSQRHALFVKAKFLSLLLTIPNESSEAKESCINNIRAKRNDCIDEKSKPRDSSNMIKCIVIFPTIESFDR